MKPPAEDPSVFDDHFPPDRAPATWVRGVGLTDSHNAATKC